jgi:Cytochrome c7 and related cytochrome c
MRGTWWFAAALLLCGGCGNAIAQGAAAPATQAGDGGAVAEMPQEPPPALTDPLRNFSHKVHVADNQIGCGVCHPFARHSPVAGLASMATCAGCHKFVGRNRLDIQRLNHAVEEGKGIEWPRIHRLPDHVFFSHERHVGRGVGCAECHGEMQSRTVAVEQQDLSMGFCMECHRARGAPIDCLTCHK